MVINCIEITQITFVKLSLMLVTHPDLHMVAAGWRMPLTAATVSCRDGEGDHADHCWLADELTTCVKY